jgi:hypothetical protein
VDHDFFLYPRFKNTHNNLRRANERSSDSEVSAFLFPLFPIFSTPYGPSRLEHETPKKKKKNTQNNTYDFHDLLLSRRGWSITHPFFPFQKREPACGELATLKQHESPPYTTSLSTLSTHANLKRHLPLPSNRHSLRPRPFDFPI